MALSKQQEVAVLVVVLVFILFSIFTLGGFKLIPLGSFYSGGMVLSVSNVLVTANNSFCSSTDCNVWESTVALTGQAQQLIASGTGLTASYTYPSGSVTNNGTTTKPLQINYVLQGETCNYPIIYKGENFYEIQYQQPGFWFSLSNSCNFGLSSSTFIWTYPQSSSINSYAESSNYQCSGGCCNTNLYPLSSMVDQYAWSSSFEQACNNVGGTWLTNNGQLACVAFTKKPMGQLYQLQSPNIDYSTQITLNNGQQTEVLNLNPSQTSAISSDNNVYAILSNGGLSATSSCPTTDLPSVFVDTNNIPHFIANINSPPAQTFSTTQNGADASTLIGEVNTFNQNTQIAINPASYTGSFTGVFNNLTIVDTLSTPVFYPIIQLFVKAQYLGILIPRMVPVITSTTCPTFQGGRTGSLIVNVQNSQTATETGSLLVSAICNGGISVISTAQMVTGLAPGRSGTATLSLSSPTNASSQCTVTASDPNNPSNSVTSTVTCTSTNPCPYTNVFPPWIVNFPNSANCTVTCGLTSCPNSGDVLDTKNCECIAPNTTGTGCAYNNPVCPTGLTCEFNTCVTPPTTCPTGQILVNNQCITPPPIQPTQPTNYTIYIIVGLIVASIGLAGLVYWYYYIRKGG
ncbi:MAG: hypothetical protein QXI16_01490 [Sulfolobaceae archaeon]